VTFQHLKAYFKQKHNVDVSSHFCRGQEEKVNPHVAWSEKELEELFTQIGNLPVKQVVSFLKLLKEKFML
jgi:hypothetical protein